MATKKTTAKASSTKGKTRNTKRTTAAASKAPARGKVKAGAARKAKTTEAPTRAATAAGGAKGKGKPTVEAKGTARATSAKSGGRKRVSLLDRAAEILAKAKEPMGAKEMVEQALADGWTTSGKTPAATLYASIIREIANKGKDARFTKVERGRFASRKAGA